MADGRSLVVRLERPEDVAAIRDVHRRAFGQQDEGRIVDALRANGAAILSLVAADGNQVVGHVMFSPLPVDEVTGAALGPMAVVPERQRQGVGSRLVEGGIAHLARAGCPFVGLIGHPSFYPRFGFRPASTRGITCEWNVPDEAFMVLVLDEAAMRGVSGPARFRDEFSAAG